MKKIVFINNLSLLTAFVLLLKLNKTFGLQCQRITTETCQGLGYNMTALPNLAGDVNYLDADLKLTKYLPLVGSNCSNHVRFLMCSSIFPLCSPDVPKPVTACKSLCEKVKQDCANEPLFEHLWPDFLTCETLPQPEKQELCMQIPHDERKIDDHKTQQPQLFWPWLSWKLTPNHINLGKTETMLKFLCPTNYTSFNQNCVPQCNTDVLYTGQQKKISEALILALSAVCFVLTLFSLVTFWAEPTRFGYPERPVLFLCLCYNLLSVCYLERIIFHNSSREVEDNDELNSISFNNGACNISSPCLASYITTSYVTLCATSWWLIFALCFYLSSNKKWSSEALEKKSGLFHVLAWVSSLVPPIFALLWGAVRSNELTGICTAPGFVEIPALVSLIIGAFFIIKASRSLKTLQEEIRSPSGSHQRFSQIRKRVMIFSLVFFIPTIISVILTFFEKVDSIIPPCASIETCIQPSKSSSLPSFLKLFFHLTGGTLTGMWVWSKKTCESYRNRIGTSPNTSTTYKSASSFQNKKCGSAKQVQLLYSGINFHNIPAYNTQTRII